MVGSARTDEAHTHLLISKEMRPILKHSDHLYFNLIIVFDEFTTRMHVHGELPYDYIF